MNGLMQDELSSVADWIIDRATRVVRRVRGWFA